MKHRLLLLISFLAKSILCGENPLIDAVLSGNTQEVLTALKSHPDVNSTDQNNRTALHLATEQGCKKIVEVLLAHGAQVNARTPEGFTPLYYALTMDHPAIAQLLVNHGAYQNNRTLYNPTPLFLAVKNNSIAMTQKLLEINLDVNAKNKNNQSALHLAQVPEIASMLINHGAIVDSGDSDGNTPLHIAVDKGLMDIVLLLLNNGANANTKNFYFLAPVHIAAMNGNAQLLALLAQYADLNAISCKKCTAIHWAVLYNHIDCSRLLINNGADLNIKNNTGTTALHLAVKNNNQSIVQLLIENNARQDIKDKYEYTPLDIALANNKIETAQVILGAVDWPTKEDIKNSAKNFNPREIWPLKAVTLFEILDKGSTYKAYYAKSLDLLHHIIEASLKDKHQNLQELLQSIHLEKIKKHLLLEDKKYTNDAMIINPKNSQELIDNILHAQIPEQLPHTLLSIMNSNTEKLIMSKLELLN